MAQLSDSLLNCLLAEKHHIPKRILDTFQSLQDNELPIALFMPSDTRINAEVKEEYYDIEETKEAENNSMDYINHDSYPYSADLCFLMLSLF